MIRQNLWLCVTDDDHRSWHGLNLTLTLAVSHWHARRNINPGASCEAFDDTATDPRQSSGADYLRLPINTSQADSLRQSQHDVAPTGSPMAGVGKLIFGEVRKDRDARQQAEPGQVPQPRFIVIMAIGDLDALACQDRAGTSSVVVTTSVPESPHGVDEAVPPDLVQQPERVTAADEKKIDPGRVQLRRLMIIEGLPGVEQVLDSEEIQVAA